MSQQIGKTHHKDDKQTADGEALYVEWATIYKYKAEICL